MLNATDYHTRDPSSNKTYYYFIISSTTTESTTNQVAICSSHQVD